MKFNEYYVIIRDEYLDTCKSFLLNDSLDMLHFYGIGGIGKTTLKNSLINNLSSENNWILNIDFEFSDNRKMAVVLEKLRSQILRYKKSSRFPRFDYAMKIYYEKSTPQYVMKERHTLPLPDESEIVANVLGEAEKINIPMISTLPKIAQTGYRYMKSIQNWLDIRNMEDLKYINQLEVEEIENLLPDLWLSDVIELKQNISINMIFLLDTFEKVGEIIEGEFKLANSFEWLGSLIEKTDFSKFITFGREKVEGVFPNKRVEHVLVEPFNFQDTKALLEKFYIGNEEFAKVFYYATEGIPYYLQLAIKTYNNIRRTRIPKIEDFEGDRKLVVERFIRYIDEKEKNMLEILSIPNFWNESLYNYLFDYDDNIYRINRKFLEESSLIYFNELEGYWSMHELMRTHLFRKLIEEKNYFFKLNNKFYDYYNGKMKNVHDNLSTYENMLRQYFYHAKLSESPFAFAMNTIEYIKSTHVKSLITLAEDITFYIETSDIPLKEVILYRLYFNINFSYLERMELEQADIWLKKNEVLFESQDKDFKTLNFINHINLKAFNALTNKKYLDAEQLYLTLISLIKESQSEEEYKDIIFGIYNHLSVVYTQLDDIEKSEYYSKMALQENDLSNPEIAAVTLINASSTDLLNNEYNKALEKLAVAFELFEKSSEYNERNFLVATK